MLQFDIRPMVVKIILLSFFFLGAVILFTLLFHDFFNKPKIEEKEVGPFKAVVKRFIGSYYKVGPTMTEVDGYLRKIGLSSTKGIGIYYDNPGKTSQDKLRSDVGDIIGQVGEPVIKKIRQKYEVKEIERQKAAVVTYPIKSFLSYMLGPMKVYPAIDEYFRKNGYSNYSFAIEIYDIANKKILYMMPVSGR